MHLTTWKIAVTTLMLAGAGLQAVAQAVCPAADFLIGCWEVPDDVPGTFVWHPTSAPCQRSALPCLKEQNQPVGVLLVGDSVDLQMLMALCTQAKGQIKADVGGPQHYDTFHVCDLPDLYIMHVFVPGVHPVGPYWLPERHNNRNCVTKFGDAATEFKKMMQPSVVMVASNLWDIVRFHLVKIEGLYETKSPKPSKLFSIPSASIVEWQGHLRDLLAAVETTFPNAKWIFKTTAYPHPEWSVTTGHPVQALNMAGAAVASGRGWRLSDANALTASFDNASDYLQDMQGHPQNYVSLTVIRMILHDACSALSGSDPFPAC